MTIINVSLEFAILVFAGFLIMRLGVVSSDFRTQLSKYVMNAALPCMIARSLYDRGDQAGSVGIATVLLLSAAALAVLFFIGQAAYFIMGRGDMAKTARFSTVFGNFTFIGFPVVSSLYGQQGLFIYSLFTLPIRIMFYASPHFLLSPSDTDGGSKPRLSGRELIKIIVTPPTISIAVGFAMLLAHVKPPEFLDGAINALGSTASPLGMLIVGMGMAGATPSLIWQRRRMAGAVLCRNIAAPAALLALLTLIPVPAQIKQVIFVYAAVPVPSLMTAFSVSLGRSEDTCRDTSVTVLISTLLGILTLPCWIFASNAVFLR